MMKRRVLSSHLGLGTTVKHGSTATGRDVELSTYPMFEVFKRGLCLCFPLLKNWREEYGSRQYGMVPYVWRNKWEMSAASLGGKPEIGVSMRGTKRCGPES